MTKQQQFVLDYMSDYSYHRATDIGRAGRDHFHPGQTYYSSPSSWAAPRLKALVLKKLIFQASDKTYRLSDK